MHLSEKMKNWPMLAAHQLEEIKAVLLSMEERLTALEPKKDEPEPEPDPVLETKPEPETKPFVPAPIPSPFVPAALEPSPFTPPPGPNPFVAPEPNPLEGVTLKS